MLKIEKTEVVGWKAAIRGMRNPLNSWDKSDSRFGCPPERQCEECAGYMNAVVCNRLSTNMFTMGKNDLDLMTRLASAGGSSHAKYRRMITVYVDITAPL